MALAAVAASTTPDEYEFESLPVVDVVIEVATAPPTRAIFVTFATSPSSSSITIPVSINNRLLIQSS